MALTPASPSKPHQKATASNNRPMDEEDGQWIFRAIIASRTSRFRTGSPSPDAYQAPPYATAPSDGPGNRRTGKVPEPLRPPPGRRNGLSRATLCGSPSSSNTKIPLPIPFRPYRTPSVPSDAQSRKRHFIFHGTGQHMSLMMLHRDNRCIPLLRQTPAKGQKWGRPDGRPRQLPAERHPGFCPAPPPSAQKRSGKPNCSGHRDAGS